MLQALSGISSNQIKKSLKGHWPIGWHVQHCMYVIDFIISRHISGAFEIEHYEMLKTRQIEPTSVEWHYPSSIGLQVNWVLLLDSILLKLDKVKSEQLAKFSQTGYRNEPLVEGFLRIINHTNAHLRSIWSLISILEGGLRLPEQGIWMPKSNLFLDLRKDLSERLKIPGNSRSPLVRKLANKYYPRIAHHDTWTIIQNCEDLMSMHGWEKTIACSWIERIQPRLSKIHFYHFERWLYLYISGWEPCDDFCKRAVNPLLMKHPALFKNILKWTDSENIWVRRASAVSLIRSEKSKLVCDYDILKVLRIADRLVEDKEPYVQKAVGWLLKTASLYFKKEVINYLDKNIYRMSRLSFRHALENIDARNREILMKL